MIIDTDVLIWYLRGNDKARIAIQKSVPFSVSAVTVMELLQGAKNKAEQRAMNKQFRVWGARVIPLDEAISIRATQYINEFALGNNLGAMDALIAATVIENDEELLTANAKHFHFIPGLALKKFTP